ncbi:MAG TPA: acetylglutamate kinase [Acidimicrobiales bacterium]|nr:acetylglutamate kinase [Acidimicrobiales bacterium]
MTGAPGALDASGLGPAEKAAVLVEALPWIRRSRGQIVVVKYGGNAMGDDLSAFAADVVALRSVGVKPVVVHGGGPQIGALLARLGMPTSFVDGLRVTDADTLDVARMVLVGRVNKDVVSALNAHGPMAVGLSGEDAALLTTTRRDERLGFVGDVASVDPTLLHRLLDEDLVPVIATIGTDDAGQAFNVNADTAAAAIAVALPADRLVFLTDVDGIRTDRHDPATRIARTTAAELARLVDDGTVAEGMVPKVRGCIDAVTSGVASAHVLDGRAPHTLLLEIFTDRGIGTMVTAT